MMRSRYLASKQFISPLSGEGGTGITEMLEFWELLSYIVTVIGLPVAIFVFLYEQRKERENEEEEVYQLLSDNYQDFLKVALDHPDLKLFSAGACTELTDEQRERMTIIFSMLVSLFERAYLLMYDERMVLKQARRWESWADYMREWCRRADFRSSLPALLHGEDPEFVAYIQQLADDDVAKGTSDQRFAHEASQSKYGSGV